MTAHAFPAFRHSLSSRYSMLAYDPGETIGLEFGVPGKSDRSAIQYARDEARWNGRARLIVRAPDGRIVFQGAA